jgi:hypothetical protein
MAVPATPCEHLPLLERVGEGAGERFGRQRRSALVDSECNLRTFLNYGDAGATGDDQTDPATDRLRA